MFQKKWGTISGILFFVAFLPYIWAIIHHQTVPSPVTWCIWASVDTLALVAMRKKKADVGQITGAVAGAWVITALAMIYGKPSMELVEWISIAGAAIGIILWQITGDALLALICSQLATFIGSFPTFAKAYNHPSQEDPLSWIIWFVSCICMVFAVKKWDLSNTLQPITFLIIETIMVALVVIRPHL